MLKICFKILCLLASASIMAQEVTPAVDAQAQQEPTISDIQEELDWTSIEQIVGNQCTQNVTVQELLSNRSNPLLLPQDYLSFIEDLGLDYQPLLAFNNTEDPFSWSADELRQGFEFFVLYHNTVAQLLSANQSLVQEEVNLPAGFNTTNITQQINFEDIWPADLNSSDLNAIFTTFKDKTIGFEILSQYYLFFGKYGIFNQQQAQPVEQQNNTPNASLPQDQAQQGFMQAQNGETQAAGGESTGQQALDANFVFMDIDRRIKEFSLEWACALDYTQNNAQVQQTQPAEEAVATQTTEETVATQPAEEAVATQPAEEAVSTEPAEESVTTEPAEDY